MDCIEALVRTQPRHNCERSELSGLFNARIFIYI